MKAPVTSVTGFVTRENTLSAPSYQSICPTLSASLGYRDMPYMTSVKPTGESYSLLFTQAGLKAAPTMFQTTSLSSSCYSGMQELQQPGPSSLATAGGSSVPTGPLTQDWSVPPLQDLPDIPAAVLDLYDSSGLTDMANMLMTASQTKELVSQGEAAQGEHNPDMG